MISDSLEMEMERYGFTPDNCRWPYRREIRGAPENALRVRKTKKDAPLISFLETEVRMRGFISPIH